MNASTFTARVVAGTGADLTSAVVAAIAALSGPLHGGANAAAMELFEQWGTAERTPDAVRELLERKAKLFGFGHPLYRAYDPRALILKRLSEELSHDADGPNWFAITDAAERTVFEEKASVPERRSLLGVGLPLPRHPDRPVHAGLRREPHGRLGRARARAARRQQDHPAVGDLRRRAAPRVPAELMTLADAAAEADAARGGGQRARALAAARAVGRGARGRGARVRLPRARGRLPRDRAVPLPHEDRAAAARARGRQPGRARLVAARAREALARSPRRDQRRPPAAARAAHARRQRGGAAAGGRLAEERLAAARHDPAARSLGDDDEQPRELREAAAKVAQLLRRKGKNELDCSCSRRAGRTTGRWAACASAQARSLRARPASSATPRPTPGPSAVRRADPSSPCSSVSIVAHAGAPGSTTRRRRRRLRGCRARSSRGRRGRASPERERRSAPPSSRWVANEWRSRCGWTRCGSSPAFSASLRRIRKAPARVSGAAARVQEQLGAVAAVEVRAAAGRGSGAAPRRRGGRSGRRAPCRPCRSRGRAGRRGRRRPCRAPTASETRRPAP